MPQFRPRQTKRAQELRNNATEAERRLWDRLRGRQLNDCKFTRQMSIGPFVCDFVCRERGLVVELDGSQHAEQESQDGKRTAFLNQRGLTVLRFWNNDVFENTDGVLEAILAALEHLPAKFEAPSDHGDSTHNAPTPQPPPASGRGLL